MRCYYPNDEDDLKQVRELEIPEWMVDEVKRNPDYPHWGPDEDYMWKDGGGRDAGWESPIRAASWADFEVKTLDDYNEIVNFYFKADRPTRDCGTCGGDGTHPDAQWIAKSWYRHSSPFRASDANDRATYDLTSRFGFGTPPRSASAYPSAETLAKYGPEFAAFCERMQKVCGHWQDDITEDEAAALAEAGQGSKTADQWNGIARGPGLGHDAINRCICVRRRCERLGVPQDCPDCEGRGHHFTGPARLGLVLWILHPRKGASRGAAIAEVRQKDLPEVHAYLREAASRNAARFARLIESARS